MSEAPRETKRFFSDSGQSGLSETLPILPVRNMVLFPQAVVPLTVGRESSIKLIEELDSRENRFLGIVAQREASVDDPQQIDLYSVGTLAVSTKQIRAKDANLVVLVQGVRRFRIREFIQTQPYITARVELLDDLQLPEDPSKSEALRRNIETLFEKVVALSPGLSSDLLTIAFNIGDQAQLADFVISAVPSFSTSLKQEFLETLDVRKRLEKLNLELTREIEILELKSTIQSQVESEVGKTQRDYYLREQLKAIQKELGEAGDGFKETNELRDAIEKAELPEEAYKEAQRELKRLSTMTPASAEYTVTRTYLDWLVSLPWNKLAESDIDLKRAREVLDRDHHGLEKIKDRILEYLAVLKLRPEGKAPILCFAGPPGVGKTSLGKSIADALGRKFVRLSLGGIRDEAEIRGHRRTYIGSLPGQIIQGIRRAEQRNPVFMLDEVDKIGADFRGDPASALLEVLDPEQNHTFRDHYLDLAFDLSRVLFVTTANVLDTIPPALLDRMEVIELHGYTEDEKLKIAQNYLLPRQAVENGLILDQHLQIPAETLRSIIRHYTREAGLRHLERQISRLCRKRARKLVEDKAELVSVGIDQLPDLLGAPLYLVEEEIEERTSVPGVAVGLAWTPTGGDVLFIEASRMKGEKNITMTGQLGNVMQESVKAALTWVRAHARELGISEDFYQQSDMHLHVPAGAIPKDGPSAGITMATTLVSLLTGRPTKARLAMTGEVTLSGKVLPVGGIKEKVLAAHRLGIREVILPRQNERNVREDLSPEIAKGMRFHFVNNMTEVLEIALGLKLRPTAKLIESRSQTSGGDVSLGTGNPLGNWN
jgi:ATP-dependent Lon protease